MSETASPFETPKTPLEDQRPSAGGVDGRASMAYMEAYKSFFRSPKWGMNLLLLSVCVLIPIVGMLAVQGYFITVIVGQHVGSADPDYPQEFKFERFPEFIGKGVWPFLASLIIGVIGAPLAIGSMVPLIFVAEAGGEPSPILLILMLLVFFLIFAVSILIAPGLMLRSGLTQSVGAIFSLTFFTGFMGRVWLEVIVSQLFLMSTSFVLVMLGYLFCGLGLYPAMALMIYAQFQIYKQLYEVYLHRDGPPIPIKEGLDQPA